MQQQNLFVKIIILSVLLVIFAVGLAFVKIVVYERHSYHQQVIREIGRNQISSQQLISPFITVPYKEQVACEGVPNEVTSNQASSNQTSSNQNSSNQLSSSDSTSNQAIAANSTTQSSAENQRASNKPAQKLLCERTSQELFFPDQINWDGAFKVSNDTYQRTIYHATSYLSELQAKGEFAALQLKNRQYNWQAAKFILPIRDLRGIHQKPILTINQGKYQLDFPKQQRPNDINYLEVTLANFNPQQQFSFGLDVHLEGLQSFSLVPTTESTIFNAKGNWADAKYYGDSLPQTKSSSKGEFRATWQNITLGYQNRQSVMSCWNSNNCQSTFTNYSNDSYGKAASETASGFAVEFIEPINIYSQTDRAIKYGWMITLISFGCFFLFEVLKGLRIHPIQYLLVGVAQSIFFVLLLSLSEQFNFLLAYNIASIACIGLMCWYLAFVLNGWKNTIIFTVLLSSLYAVMYVLLQSSEKTFLMGSIFSFMLVAGVMFITRHVDWYQLSYRK